MPNKQLIINFQADQDLDNAALYLAESRGQDTAFRFYAACDAGFQRLLTYPKIGKLYPSLNPAITDIRVWAVPKFGDYLIFYRESPDSIEILRIVHGARDIPTLFTDEFEN